MMIAEYIRVPSEAAKQTAPHHLNFGVRWGTPLVNDTQYAGTEYYDVFTINHYVNMPDTALLRRITQVTGKPLLIGEFHSGSLDRGLLSNGIIASPSQQERAIYYSYYVEQVAALPGVVGTHYFQLMDQPLLGRGDGENHGIGLCDVTHKPYTELIAGMTKTNANIYAVCLGEKAPSAVKPTTTVTE